MDKRSWQIILRVLVGVSVAYAGYLLLGWGNAYLLAYLPLLIAVFFIEQYYSSPATVLANAFALLLLFLSEKETFSAASLIPLWIVCLSSVSVLLAAALIVKSLQEAESQGVNIARRVLAELGSAKLLYGLTFLLFVIAERSFSSATTLGLGIILLLALYSKTIHDVIDSIADAIVTGRLREQTIGRIVSLEGGTALKLQLNDYMPSGSRVGVKDQESITRNFILTDVLTLEGVIYAEALLIDVKPFALGKSRSVFTSDAEEIEAVVGRIKSGADIDRIIFEPFTFCPGLQQDDVISIRVPNRDGSVRKVLYQITNVTAEESAIATNMSRQGHAVYAEQLGCYVVEDRIFSTYGWTPHVNQLVYNETRLEELPEIREGEFELGHLPKIELPIFLDLDTAVTHHMAVIGVTGSGKSYTVRKLLLALNAHGTNTIVVDFTGEYKKKFIEASLPYTQLNATNIDSFLLATTAGIGLYELPDISNTADLIDTTQAFLEHIFNKYRSSEPPTRQLCLILEEAHTIVPERDFLGVNNWDTKATVNKIGQIALQGRKYGIGLWVVAQRTANVSKTVLTQCNTVLCFQVFDNTTKDFVGNYVGDEFKKNLSHLKQYHAVVAGKAISSNRPVILDLKDQPPT